MNVKSNWTGVVCGIPAWTKNPLGALIGTLSTCLHGDMWGEGVCYLLQLTFGQQMEVDFQRLR